MVQRQTEQDEVDNYARGGAMGVLKKGRDGGTAVLEGLLSFGPAALATELAEVETSGLHETDTKHLSLTTVCASHKASRLNDQIHTHTHNKGPGHTS